VIASFSSIGGIFVVLRFPEQGVYRTHFGLGIIHFLTKFGASANEFFGLSATESADVTDSPVAESGFEPLVPAA
jgi:hypothetical protein